MSPRALSLQRQFASKMQRLTCKAARVNSINEPYQRNGDVHNHQAGAQLVPQLIISVQQSRALLLTVWQFGLLLKVADLGCRSYS